MALPQPPSAGPRDADTPDIIGHRSWSHPRWPFLAALLITPWIIIGYLLNLYYTYNVCTLGSYLCSLTLSDALQVLLILLAFALFWFLALIFGVTRLEGGQSTGPVSTFLSRISNFEPVRELLIWGGGAVFLLLLISILLGRLTAVGLAMSVIMISVALCTFFWHPPVNTVSAATTPQAQQRRVARGSAGLLFTIRSLPPFRWFAHNRAPAPARNVNQPPPSRPSTPAP